MSTSRTSHIDHDHARSSLKTALGCTLEANISMGARESTIHGSDIDNKVANVLPLLLRSLYVLIVGC